MCFSWRVRAASSSVTPRGIDIVSPTGKERGAEYTAEYKRSSNTAKASATARKGLFFATRAILEKASLHNKKTGRNNFGGVFILEGLAAPLPLWKEYVLRSAPERLLRGSGKLSQPLPC